MDETQPLLQTANGVVEHNTNGKDLIDFDPYGDSDNPRDWPKAYKWGIVGLLAFMAFTV